MVSLYRDPEGNNVLSGTIQSESSTMRVSKKEGGIVSTNHDSILRARIKELEDQLEANGITPTKVSLLKLLQDT